MELNHFSNFGRGSPKELFCEIILSLGEDVIYSFFSIFSSGNHFVKWSGTFLAILVEGHTRKISVKLF